MEQSTKGTEQHVVEVTPRNAERNDGVVYSKDVFGDAILNTDTGPVDDVEETVRQKIGDEILVENSDYDIDTQLAVLKAQISIKRSYFDSRNEKPKEEEADITKHFEGTDDINSLSSDKGVGTGGKQCDDVMGIDRV